MKLKKPKCPTCGEPARGTVDVVVAEFDDDPTKGHIEYSGDTDIDNQTTLKDTKTGLPFVTCWNGHTWATRITGLS